MGESVERGRAVADYRRLTEACDAAPLTGGGDDAEDDDDDGACLELDCDRDMFTVVS